jgi:hypothetical protein
MLLFLIEKTHKKLNAVFSVVIVPFSFNYYVLLLTTL